MKPEFISITHDGSTYTAERTVTGVRKIRQYLTFPDGRIEHDSKTYSPGQEEEMLCTARLMVWQRNASSWKTPSA